MTPDRKYFPPKKPAASGNAMIYVLIVIALFAALAFVLSRQRGTSEATGISTNQVNIDATQILQVSNQVKQAVDQMLYSGSSIDQLDFCQPTDSCFTVGSAIHRVFSPDGGGVVLPQLPAEAMHQVDNNPAPGWYMGAFNNVEWTPLGPDGPAGCPGLPAPAVCPAGCPSDCPAPWKDVIFVAHQISQPICAQIDLLLTGSATIPMVASGIPLARIFINPLNPDGGARHSNGTDDLTATTGNKTCPACEGHATLCVSDNPPTMYSFYNVIEQR